VSSRVLITGAQGFVGRYVVADWLLNDPTARIVGIGRSRPLSYSFTHRLTWEDARFRAPLPIQQRLAAAHERYRYVRVDIRDRSSLIQLLREVRPSVVLHLAGALRDEPASRLFSLNVLGTVTLFEAIAQADVRSPTVVLGSTGSLYGTVPDERLPIREDEPPAPFDLYSASKEAAERVARILSSRNNIPTIFARIFNVVGPGQDERHLCGWLAHQMVAVKLGAQSQLTVGPLDTSRDFVDVRDVARALRLLAGGGVPAQSYNVASGIETPTRRVFDQLRELSGLDQNLPVVRRAARPADCVRVVADIGRLGALGYQPEFSLRQSLSDVLRYYTGRVVAAAERTRSRATPGINTDS
jgi:nucleoside-diphosphate-sugar epimerase